MSEQFNKNASFHHVYHTHKNPSFSNKKRGQKERRRISYSNAYEEYIEHLSCACTGWGQGESRRNTGYATFTAGPGDRMKVSEIAVRWIQHPSERLEVDTAFARL